MDGERLICRTDFGEDVNGLSGGQLAAVSLALVLALNGDEESGLLVLDEPDANLDGSVRVRFAELLKQKAV